MKLSFNKSDLANAIQIVQSCISTKSTLPVLSNILVEASAEGKVKLAATDLEVGVRCTVKAEVLEEGKITVPAKKFGEVIRELPDHQEITLTCKDGKKVEIKCGKIKATLNSLSPDDFPVIPEFPEKKAFQLDKSIFKEMIRKTCFATSTDETRYILNGIYFMVNNNELKMVATDGRRLAYVSKDNAQKDLSANVIIPSKAINELLRLISLNENEKDNKINIAPFENQISFSWSNNNESIVLISRIIDGTFPNYEQVIPKSKEIELKIKTEQIFSAVRRAALFAQDRGGSVRFSFTKNLLRISANAQGLGEEEEDLEIDYPGKEFEIAFNPAFLLDILKNNDSAEVQFEFSTALNPGLIKPADNDRYLCVIMPMRLQ